jgi:hypothetical protein
MPRIWEGLQLSGLRTHPRRAAEPSIAFLASRARREQNTGWTPMPPLAFRTVERPSRAMPEATYTVFVFRSREIQFSGGTKRNRRDSVQCLQPSNGRCNLNRGTLVRYQNIRAFDNHHNSRSDPPCDDRSAESRISLAPNMPCSRIGRSPPLAIF